MRVRATLRVPSIEDVERARKEFINEEPRNLFYLVASELIDLVRKGMSKKVSIAQALAVLLQTWNVSFYRFRGGFRETDLEGIKVLLRDYLVALEVYRAREIATFSHDDEETTRDIFDSFQQKLGPVGAAKCLHLLAPAFFPLWDRAIAKKYCVALNPTGYIEFMNVAKEQCQLLRKQNAPWPDLLKAIDEYNYCTYTLKTPA